MPVYLPSDRINTSLPSYQHRLQHGQHLVQLAGSDGTPSLRERSGVILNYTWAKATDTGQVAGSSGTFYGGDTPLDPNNLRGENGPSDVDIRNRFTMSFVYQPQIFESNKIVKYALDDFIFSGT